MPVMEYLYPSYSALNTEHCRIYQQNYDENLQLTVTVVITNLRFLVDYSCQDYKFMLGVTWKHVDCDEKEGVILH